MLFDAEVDHFDGFEPYVQRAFDAVVETFTRYGHMQTAEPPGQMTRAELLVRSVPPLAIDFTATLRNPVPDTRDWFRVSVSDHGWPWESRGVTGHGAAGEYPFE